MQMMGNGQQNCFAIRTLKQGKITVYGLFIFHLKFLKVKSAAS